MDEVVLCGIEAGLCTIVLNRPHKLNALNLAMFEAIGRQLDRIDQVGLDVRCVLLRGTGRSFCAGHDLDDIVAGAEEAAAKRFETGIVERLAELPMPVLAAVQGHCLTGGLELALTADVIVATESAIFADTHGLWDLVPVWGLSQRLPRRIGRARALEMMFTSRRYSGRDAEAMGLANFCVVDTALDAEVERLAADILANSARANRAMKALLVETDGLPIRAGIAYELHHTAGRGPEMAARLDAMRKQRSG